MVPTFTAHRSAGEAPSYAPAISPRLRRRPSPWPPAAATLTRTGVPNTGHVLVRIAYQPESTGLELAGDLRSVNTGSSRTPSPLLAGPGPSGSAGPSRRCRGCLPPSPASPGSGCPQLRHAAATTRRRRSLTPARYSAPRGARGRPPSARVGSGPRAGRAVDGSFEHRMLKPPAHAVRGADEHPLVISPGAQRGAMVRSQREGSPRPPSRAAVSTADSRTPRPKRGAPKSTPRCTRRSAQYPTSV